MNARPNIPDYQHQANKELAAALTEQGFSFEVTAQGYFVRFKGKGLGGARTLKKVHGRHTEANRRDYLQSALTLAMRHNRK